MMYNEYCTDEELTYYGTMSQSEFARAVFSGAKVFGVEGIEDWNEYMTEGGPEVGSCWTSYLLGDGDMTFAEARAEMITLDTLGDMEEDDPEDYNRGFEPDQAVDPWPDPEDPEDPEPTSRTWVEGGVGAAKWDDDLPF